MITRKEFYCCYIIIALLMIGDIFCTDSGFLELKRARIETRDSIMEVQRDSALALALKKELAADSLQAIVNIRNLDINNIKKKYANEKKNIMVLGADSTLSYFLRTTRGN